MKKLAIFLPLVLLATAAFSLRSVHLTFDADDVINHARGRARDYNTERHSTDSFKTCVTNTIASFNQGNFPEQIAKYYKGMWFRNDGYTMSVIAHYCDGTFQKMPETSHTN